MPDQASLLTELAAAFAFADQIIVSAHATDPAGQFLQPLSVRSFMTEAAVVKIHVSWEHYLEQSFLSYLMGTPSATGTAVTSYLTAPTIQHANSVLIGTQKYVDWGNPEIVVRLAGLYFAGGAPYQAAIAAVQVDLFDLRSLRNAAAHLSTTTSAQLDALALRRLCRATTGNTVYDLVTAADQNRPGKTLLASYVDMLTAAATLIANN